jgi:hypothetical protein
MPRGRRRQGGVPGAQATDDRFVPLHAPVLATCPTQAPWHAPATFSIRGAHGRPPQHPPSRCTLQPLSPHPREAPRQGWWPAFPPSGRRRPLSARGSRPLDCIEPPAHDLRPASYRSDPAGQLAQRYSARAPPSPLRPLRAHRSCFRASGERRSRATSERRSAAAPAGRSKAPRQPALPSATPAALPALLSGQRAALPSGSFARPRSRGLPPRRQHRAQRSATPPGSELQPSDPLRYTVLAQAGRSGAQPVHLVPAQSSSLNAGGP